MFILVAASIPEYQLFLFRSVYQAETAQSQEKVSIPIDKSTTRLRTSPITRVSQIKDNHTARCLQWHAADSHTGSPR